MIQPKPSFDFDAATLRDAKLKQKFDTLLAQAQALRGDGTFVALATNRALLASIESLYAENLDQYARYYRNNKAQWRMLREQVAIHKNDIDLIDYQNLLASIESVEAYFVPHDYAENAKTGPLLENIETQLNEAITSKKQRENALHQYRLDLKQAMETVWAEDYAPLKQEYQRLKKDHSVHDVIKLEPDRVAVLTQKRTAKFKQTIEAFGKNKADKKALLAFEQGYAYERDLDALVEKIIGQKRRKRILLIGLVLSVILLVAVSIWKLPNYIRENAIQADFERVKLLDRWQDYSGFIEQYPGSPLAEKAGELRGLLDYGEIDALALMSGDTVRYEGQLDAGVPDGNGKAVFQNGQIYDGAWRAGKKEGQGTLTFPDGGEFVGTFDNNIQEKGMLRRADGTEYSGNWKDGKLTGDGSARWPDGSRYTGTWKQGKFDGYGTLKAGRNILKYVPEQNWQEGTMYTGSWKVGLRHGQGTYSYVDGRVFVGAWKNDAPDGRPGTLKWKDGSYFRGVWVKGTIKGDGTYIDRFGNDFQGFWEGTPANITRKVLRSNKIEKGRFEGGIFKQS